MERAARTGAAEGQAARMRSAAALEACDGPGVVRSVWAWMMTWAGGRAAGTAGEAG
jgi:hypothetical protein